MENAVRDSVVMVHQGERRDSALNLNERFYLGDKRQGGREVELESLSIEGKAAVTIVITTHEMTEQSIRNATGTVEGERFAGDNSVRFESGDQRLAINLQSRRWINLAFTMGRFIRDWLVTFQRQFQRFEMMAIFFGQRQFKATTFRYVAIRGDESEPIGLRLVVDDIKERFVAGIRTIDRHVWDFTPILRWSKQ